MGLENLSSKGLENLFLLCSFCEAWYRGITAKQLSCGHNVVVMLGALCGPGDHKVLDKGI